MRKVIPIMMLIMSQSLWADMSYSPIQVGTMALGFTTAAADGVGCGFSVLARRGLSNSTSDVERSLLGSSITFGISSLLMAIAGASAFGPSKFTQVGQVASGVAGVFNVISLVESAVAHGIEDHDGDVSVDLKVSASMGYVAPALNFIHFILGLYVTMRRVDDAVRQHSEPAPSVEQPHGF